MNTDRALYPVLHPPPPITHPHTTLTWLGPLLVAGVLEAWLLGLVSAVVFVTVQAARASARKHPELGPPSAFSFCRRASKSDPYILVLLAALAVSVGAAMLDAATMWIYLLQGWGGTVYAYKQNLPAQLRPLFTGPSSSFSSTSPPPDIR